MNDKDLERLEKLEKVIKILKRSFKYEFTLYADTNTINQMYFETGRVECRPFGVKNKEEFELLKEVLSNE